MAKLLAGDVKDGDFKEFEGTAEDISILEDSLERECREAYSTLNADPNDQTIYYKVLKQVKGYKKPFDCFQFNHSELDGVADRIREEFGSGFYIVNMIKNGKLHKKIDYPILAPTAATAAAAPSSDLATVLREMREERRVMFEQLQSALMQGSGTPALPQNPLTLLKDLADVMKQIAPPPAAQTSFKDMLETMAMFKELMPESRGAGETNWMDVLSKAMDSPLLGNILEGAAQGAKRQGQLPAPAPGAAPQPVPKQPQSEDEMKELIIRNYIGNLIKRAEANQDPGFVAEMMLNDAQMYKIPVEVLKTEMLSKEALDKLSVEHPQITTYRAWFDAVQTQMLELLKDAGAA